MTINRDPRDQNDQSDSPFQLFPINLTININNFENGRDSQIQTRRNQGGQNNILAKSDSDSTILNEGRRNQKAADKSGTGKTTPEM